MGPGRQGDPPHFEFVQGNSTIDLNSLPCFSHPLFFSETAPKAGMYAPELFDQDEGSEPACQIVRIPWHRPPPTSCRAIGAEGWLPGVAFAPLQCVRLVLRGATGAPVLTPESSCSFHSQFATPQANPTYLLVVSESYGGPVSLARTPENAGSLPFSALCLSLQALAAGSLKQEDLQLLL